MNNAICVLTRGYDNINDYNMLIKRNVHISRCLKDKNIKLLIFHEGNISKKQQTFISLHTPELILEFIDISMNAFKKEKAQISFDEKIFHDGYYGYYNISYRHMCSFWFVDFWHYVKDYDKIIRIDEDCIVDCNLDDLFLLVNGRAALFGDWVSDHESVIINLSLFTENFCRINNIKFLPRNIEGPYTNFIVFNLDLLRTNNIMFSYINSVDVSNNIYIHRWGDLPLWGEVLYYFFNKEDYNLCKNIKYFHGSHRLQVN